MSTKGRGPGMKEKRGRSPSLSRKPEIRQQETRGRSPSLPRKTESGKRGRSVNPPSIQERKKVSTSIESRNVPTLPWLPTSVNCGPSARNPNKQLSPPKIKSRRRSLDKPIPPFRVTSTKSKSNPINIIASSAKMSGLIKHKGFGTSGSPLKLKNSVNGKGTNVCIKKQTSQTTEGLGIEKKPIMSNALTSSQEDQNIIFREENDYNIVTQEGHDRSVVTYGNDEILHDEVTFEDGSKIRVCEPLDFMGLVGDQDVSESEICCDDDATFDGSVDNEHEYDYDDNINQQDQADETFDITSNYIDHAIVDQENQESGNEQVADVGSTYEHVEDIEETKLQELEHEESELGEPEKEVTERDELLHVENKLKEPDEHEETDVEKVEHEETKPDELKIKEHDVRIPKDEDTTSKVVVKNQQVVIHGKKESATYNDVIEETLSKLREQRKNRVLALARAFETVISLESELSPKDMSPKGLSPKYKYPYQ